MAVQRQRIPSESDVHVAQRYLETLLDSNEGLAPGELEAIQQSIQAIREGRMTLEEFERKNDV